MTWRRGALVLGALIVTRWALAPKYLFYIDNVNFALAMEHFQPLLHQPHPPGYPLYVALLDMLHLLIGGSNPSVKYVQLASGTLGSLVALLSIWKLGDEMFERPAGGLAAALLFFLPAFWLAGIGNQVRTFIAAGSIAVALCAWRAMSSESGDAWLIAGAATLGVAGGFRPELVILLFPLLCLAWLMGTRKIGTAIAALAVLFAVTGAWLSVLIWRTGGLSSFAGLLHSQCKSGTGGTTILSGATLRQNLFNAGLAVYWTGIGTLAWIGAVAVVWRQIPDAIDRRRMLFLLCWFLPPFLFHVIIYITDPDTALDCIPAVLLLGGCVLSLALQSSRRRDLILVATAAMTVNVTIFFVSPLHQGRDASFAWVQLVGNETSKTIDGITALSKGGSATSNAGRATTVILDRALVTSRQMTYYFPQLKVVNVDNECPPRLSKGTERVIWIRSFTLHEPAGPPFQTGYRLSYADVARGSVWNIHGCAFTNE